MAMSIDAGTSDARWWAATIGAEAAPPIFAAVAIAAVYIHTEYPGAQQDKSAVDEYPDKAHGYKSTDGFQVDFTQIHGRAYSCDIDVDDRHGYGLCSGQFTGRCGRSKQRHGCYQQDQPGTGRDNGCSPKDYGWQGLGQHHGYPADAYCQQGQSQQLRHARCLLRLAHVCCGRVHHGQASGRYFHPRIEALGKGFGAQQNG